MLCLKVYLCCSILQTWQLVFFAVNLLHTFGERGFEFPSSDGRLWCRPSLHPHLLFLCCRLLQVSVNVKLVVIFGWQWYKLVGDSRESRICFQKLDKKHFSEFVRQDGKLDKQHELVILILVLNCQTSQITSFPIIFFHTQCLQHYDHPWLSGVGDYSVVGQTKQREKSLTITFSTIFVAFIICFVPWCEHFDGVRRTILN